MPTATVPQAGPGQSAPTDWRTVRLHIITGKGGTGKSTLAAALALALAHEGRRVLLAEVEQRQGLAPLFDQPPLSYQERQLASSADGGSVFGLAVDPKAALLEYLEMFYRLGRAGGLLEKVGAIEFATTIAPGVRDVLLTGKVYEAVRRKVQGKSRYDAVVLDAPPTGRIHRFLNVNSDVAGLAKVGPIKAQADSIMTLLRSPETAVHLVTLLEELPSQETQEGIAGLRAAHLPVGAIIANQIRPAGLSARLLASARKGELDPGEISAGLAAAGLADGPAEVVEMQGIAQVHAGWIAGQRRERLRLQKLGQPIYEVPARDRIDPGELFAIADILRTQGQW